MPNTFTMQELARMSLDEHHENLEGGRSFSEPVIYSVKKGRLRLAQWFAQSLTTSRYPYSRCAHTTQDGCIKVLPSTLKPCAFERYEGQTPPSVELADKIFA